MSILRKLYHSVRTFSLSGSAHRMKNVFLAVKENLVRIGVFVFLIIFYIIGKTGEKLIGKLPFLGKRIAVSAEEFLSRFKKRVRYLANNGATGRIDKIELIEIAIRNLKIRKARTLITVGGMAIGIGAIVFFVSIGYGLQDLVITKVAKLEELKQADVSPQRGGQVKLSDETLSDFSQIPGVATVFPLIAAVGRVTYQNSISDLAVYGVTTNYLSESAIRTSSGNFFDSSDTAVILSPHDGPSEKSANEPYLGKVNGDVRLQSKEKTWATVREEARTDSRILGYAPVSDTEVYNGQEIVGGGYAKTGNGNIGSDENGLALGKWVNGLFPLWKKDKACPAKSGCDGGYVQADETADFTKGYVALADSSLQIRSLADVIVEKVNEGRDIADNNAVSDAALMEILAGQSQTSAAQTQRIALGSAAKKEVVVNQAFLSVLGLSEGDAIDQELEVSFVITGNLLGSEEEKRIETVPEKYKIVGVVPVGKEPFAYVPFMDLRSLGIHQFSQMRVSVDAQESLSLVRNRIEGMGFITTSVTDTVKQIDVFFAKVRIAMWLLGMVALGVAALGMFNTLTVSLLERTHEVGLMKAMGMKSVEVKELFLTESMVMAFFGGIFGLLFGILAGKGLGFILSLFSLFQGAGTIDVSSAPLPFVAAIVIFSLVVGILTGIYPARRATSISALQALRYE